MNKVNTLTLAIVISTTLAACSTQQTSQQSQVAGQQNTSQSQVGGQQNSSQSQVGGQQNASQSQTGGQQAAPKAQGVVAAKPATMPKAVAKKVTKPIAVATRPPARVIPVKARPVARKPAVVRKPAVIKKPTPVRRPVVAKPRVAPAAPKVQTVKRPTPRPANKQTPWQRRQQVMTRMQSWTMGGRSALRFKGNAWTFGLTWVQRNKAQFRLQIRNPITGTVVAVLDQNPGKATLTSRGKVSSGADAERLLQQQMGVKMPVNGMPYWIRGVMAPQYPVGQVVLDAKGRPKKIVQAGWVMEYFNYQSLSFDALPRKVNISRKQEQVNVRILAKQWKTR